MSFDLCHNYCMHSKKHVKLILFATNINLYSSLHVVFYSVYLCSFSTKRYDSVSYSCSYYCLL